MSEDQFTRLFNYMQDEFAKVHAELSTKANKDMVERVISMLDEDVKIREIDDHERIALGAQLDRLVTRVSKLEKKVAS